MRSAFGLVRAPLVVTLAVSGVVAALVAVSGAVPAAASWSAPARPPGCAAALTAAAPLIVFPSSAPTTRSGPGALLWVAPRGCVADPAVGDGVMAGATTGEAVMAGTTTGEVMAGTTTGEVMAGATTGEAVKALLGVGARPGRAQAFSAKAGPTALTAAAGTAAGQVVTVGSGAVASAYLGDVAVAAPVRTRAGWALAVRVQRHYSRTLSPAHLVPVGPSPVTALAVTLDYRAEILLVWADRRAIYARELSQSGEAAQPAHRLTQLEPGSSAPELGALQSDDGHAIVAWYSQSRSDRTPTTTLQVSISAAALTWAPPRTLERFRDLGGFAPPAVSLRLIRLSSEAVMLAWTGMHDGRYVVRASPVSLHRGAWAPVAISGTAKREAVLGDLVAGPHAEALAVWRSAPRLPGDAPDPQRWAILAARGHYAGHGEVSFAVPETVAPAARNGPPAAAIDPRTGRALVAWVAGFGGETAGRVEYALRSPDAAAALMAHRTRGDASGSFPVAATVLAALALAAATLTAFAIRARGVPRTRVRGW